MKGQAFNPYLPADEYIPDGEPYVFGNRVYVYGSHDKFDGVIFCLGDYVCWSAPVDDLSDWRCEGVIYKKNQDPKNRLGLRLLFAPDVAQGPDGRFYLYYAFDFMGIMGGAVCDTPAGQYKFLGHVHYKDGTIWGRKNGDPFPFDPGVLVDDDKKVYLYSGFYTPVPPIVTGGKHLRFDGCVVMELEADMLTIRTDPKVIFPKEGVGSFKDHEFFEASSMRKIGTKYYFVYSSKNNHELCYAVSDRPDGGFEFGGTLVDLGDLYLNGNRDETHAKNYLGNTHGGMVQISGQWYIFYHRHTNRHSYSRQACAEPISMDKNGHFKQAEVTSCGLNAAPLKDAGRYEARIACNLWSKYGTGRYDCKNPQNKYAAHPYFTQEKSDGRGVQFIANMRDGAVAGFKYFAFEYEAYVMELTVRGTAEGKIVISNEENFDNVLGTISISLNERRWKTVSGAITAQKGTAPIYVKFIGKGAIDFKDFALKKGPSSGI